MVVYNAIDKSYEEVGNCGGNFKFSRCCVTADGNLIMVPEDYRSSVIYNPLDKNYDEKGILKRADKVLCCSATADGRLIMVP